MRTKFLDERQYLWYRMRMRVDAVETELDTLHNVIDDMCYSQGLPNDEKAAAMLSFAEIIVRRLLRERDGGDFNLRNAIDELSRRGCNKRSLDAADKIRVLCDRSIDANENGITDADIKMCAEAVLDLYAGLFIDFFERHPICEGSRSMLYMFSFLPPVIRWKALTDLWDSDKTNRLIIDKLCLAILKTRGKESAASWVQEHRAELEGIIAVGGSAVAWMMIPGAPKNMYELCMEKVEDVGARIERDGLAYGTLEEAKHHYDVCVKDLYLDNDEQREFKALMDFCFENRKEEIKSNAGKWLIVKDGEHGKEAFGTLMMAKPFENEIYKA